MRSSTAGEDTVLATAAGYVTYYRVKIADALGAMQDMGTLGGYDWLDSVVLDGDIDAPCAALTVTLKREQDTGSGLLSLSPLRTDSALNASGAAIGVGRTIWFEFATKALGSSRPADGSTDWKRKFVGTTDKVSFPEGPFMTVTARDQGCDLVDLWLPPAPNMVDGTGALGERCSLEALMSAILQEGLGDPTATITAPTPSNYVVTSFPRSNAESVMDCLLRAAAFVGGDVRYAWNDTDGEYQPTLIVPDRTSPSSVFTIAPSQVEERREVALDRLAVRNHIFVSYRSNVTASRQEVGASDSTSITLYGERVLKVWEDDDSPINTADEAQDFAGLILSDLKDPKVSQELSCLPDWRLELHDYGTFSANKFFDTDKDLALVGLRYEMTPNKQRMILKTRGTPSAAYRRWLLRAYNHGIGTTADADNGLTNLAFTDSADGSTRTWTWTRGVNVAYIAKFEGLVALPVSSVFWPATNAVGPAAIAGTPGYSILGTGTDSYAAARPNYGVARIATIVPYYKVGGGYAMGEVLKLQFDGVGAPIAQGTVSVGADGAVTFTADLPDGAESCRYGTSTSAFPAEATVAASGTVINGSTTGEVTPGVTLTFGDSVYITIVPFTGTGVQLPSIRLLGSFLTYQATKTATFGLRAFVPESLGGSVSMTFVNGNARASSASYPAGLSVILWPLLPPGCEVTDLEMECNMRVGTTATSEVRVDLYAGLATTTPTIVAQGYGTPNIGWQLVAATFSDTVSTSDDLTIVVALFAESAANDVEAAYVRVTYIMPQPDKAL